ncbi:MAG: hypothetical protein BWY74_02214 [Firmicutes bacterium ADurb.Bin419]|nr:MAG: hypothetical protein BWY74_02214 [Firmicutes bacterium ADurb.Bin419]
MKKKIIVALNLCLVIIFVSVFNAYAYEYSLMNDGYYQCTVDVNLSEVKSDSYLAAFNSAISAWNNAGTNTIYISKSSSSNNYLYSAYRASSSYGTYSILTTGSNQYHLTTKFSITLNTRVIGSDISTVGKSTAVHEFGHSFGLNDMKYSSTVIMGYQRNRLTMTTPQTDDVLGVIASWNR